VKSSFRVSITLPAPSGNTSVLRGAALSYGARRFERPVERTVSGMRRPPKSFRCGAKVLAVRHLSIFTFSRKHHRIPRRDIHTDRTVRECRGAVPSKAFRILFTFAVEDAAQDGLSVVDLPETRAAHIDQDIALACRKAARSAVPLLRKSGELRLTISRAVRGAKLRESPLVYCVLSDVTGCNRQIGRDDLAET